MKTRRVLLPAGLIDEFTHSCPGRVDGEPCEWTYHVTHVQPKIAGHAEQRHIDADVAFAAHVAAIHPNAQAEAYGGSS